jgi:hypothetical protein
LRMVIPQVSFGGMADITRLIDAAAALKAKK